MICPLLLAAMWLLAGCEQPVEGQDLLEAKIFTATLPGGDGTKTLLSDASDDPRKVLWQDGDLVRIVGATQADYRAGNLSSERTSATLTPENPGSAVSQANSSGYYEAFYPASLYDGGKFVLPLVQSYTPVVSTSEGDRVVASHLPMYARNTETSLAFRNLCAVLNFQLKSTDADKVTRIEVTSADSFLCGEFEVAETSSGNGDWHAVMKSSGTGLSKTVTLDCTGAPGGCVQLGSVPTEFCVAVPANTYAKDKLTVEVYGPSSSNPILSFANETADAITGSVAEYSKIYEIPRTVKPKYLPGLFSVSETEQVYFSRGNLQVNYTGTGSGYTREWLFSENQWDVFYPTAEELNSLPNPPEGTTVKLSHFGWATAGHKNPEGNYASDVSHTAYEPHVMLAGGFGPNQITWDNYSLGSGGTNPYNSWNSERAGGVSPANKLRSYCDWGIHFDGDGVGDDNKYDGTGFTMSAAQWNYLLTQRLSFDQKRGLARIDINPDPAQETFVNGLVIVPDGDWQCPDGCSFSPVANGYPNAYDAATDWPLMEASGAVFLPAAGYRRNSTTFAALGLHGYYWSSSPHNNPTIVYQLHFHDNLVNPQPDDINGARYSGFSVRLVHYGQ